MTRPDKNRMILIAIVMLLGALCGHLAGTVHAIHTLEAQGVLHE